MLKKLKNNISKLVADIGFSLCRLFYCVLFREDELMMAMLWVQQILLGKKKYSDVPRLLKEQVKELLIDSGYEELVTD